MTTQTDPHTAALLIIGNEVLSAKVDEQNIPFLLRALRLRGIEVTEVRVVPDQKDTIVAAIRELANSATYLFTTGGIGPTHDDVTIEAAAAAFGRGLTQHPELQRRIEAHYGTDINDARRRMAEVPEGSEVTLGTEAVLPVIAVENVFLFPGVPSLMRICFDRIADTLSGTEFFSETIYLTASETMIAAQLAEVQNRHVEIAIGSYPQFGAKDYRVKVTIDGRDASSVQSAFEDLQSTLDPSWVIEIS